VGPETEEVGQGFPDILLDCQVFLVIRWMAPKKVLMDIALWCWL
jgi:hypothetical protein